MNWLLFAVGLAFIALAVFPAVSAWTMVHPLRRPLFAHPSDFGVPFRDLTITGARGAALRGWWLPAASEARGTVVLCHGIQSNRCDFLTEAIEVTRHGWSAVLFDLRGHGESEGQVTFGVLETDDLRTVLAHLRAEGAPEPFVLYGFSLGAVTALHAAAAEPAVAGVIADSPFARLDATLGGPAALRLTGPARPLFFALGKFWCERFGGVTLDGVRSHDAAAGLGDRPLLLIHGAADAITPHAHSERIRAAASGPVELWLVPGAGHGETIGAAGYERRLLEFLDALPHR